MKKAKWIDFLKLRASIGLVGNDQGNSVRFMYMDGVWNDAGAYYFGTGKSDGVPRYELGTPGNKGVTWETALKANVGLDFDLFNYRLHFSGDIFKEHRTGILIAPRSLPAIIATSLPNMNLGEVDNQGYEIELGWKDNIGQFTYDLNANVTFARNKIIFEDEVEPEFEYQRETFGSTGRYMLYQFERLYQKSDFYTDENGVQRLNPDLPQPSNTVYPGDCMYKDLSGDGVIDGRDRMYDGYPNRPEYVFGSNWKFGYKGFNLNLNWVAATNVSRVWNDDYRIPFTNSGHLGARPRGRHPAALHQDQLSLELHGLHPVDRGRLLPATQERQFRLHLLPQQGVRQAGNQLRGPDVHGLQPVDAFEDDPAGPGSEVQLLQRPVSAGQDLQHVPEHHLLNRANHEKDIPIHRHRPPGGGPGRL